METPTRDAASYVQAALDLAPHVRRFHQEIERDRMLPPALVTTNVSMITGERGRKTARLSRWRTEPRRTQASANRTGFRLQKLKHSQRAVA
jgi:hypothetical protein